MSGQKKNYQGKVVFSVYEYDFMEKGLLQNSKRLKVLRKFKTSRQLKHSL